MQITQDLNKIKKSPAHPFVDIGKYVKCAKIQQKILNCNVVGARQSFKFSDKIPGFLKTIELCLNFCTGFSIINVIKL